MKVCTTVGSSSEASLRVGASKVVPIYRAVGLYIALQVAGSSLVRTIKIGLNI